MKIWEEEIKLALKDFLTVSQLAGDEISPNDIQVEILEAPHKPPSHIPKGKMAIYAFWWNGVWLKVGKAGPKSNARYTSQHYNAGSARSTLAGSLINDPRMDSVNGFDPNEPGAWIKASTCRANILLPANRNKELLSLLEAFLHVRLAPRYEG